MIGISTYDDNCVSRSQESWKFLLKSKTGGWNYAAAIFRNNAADWNYAAVFPKIKSAA